MKLKSIKINTYEDLKTQLGGFPNRGEYIYRGLSSNYTSLIPSIQYLPIKNKAKRNSYEKKLLKAFCELLIQDYNYPQNLAKVNNWDIWFLARHFGLNSRLIDFTIDITTALQFAFESSKGESIYLWALKTRTDFFKQVEDLRAENPFKLSDMLLINPSLNYAKNFQTILGDKRMFIQNGRFFYQPQKNDYGECLSRKYHKGNWKIFEIPFNTFNQFILDVKTIEGIDMTKPLLISNHCIDGLCLKYNKILHAGF